MSWRDNIPRLRPLIATAVGLILFTLSLIWPRYDAATANRMHAILVLCICLWIGNGTPPFVPALLIPFLAILMEVFADSASSTEAANRLLSAMCSSILIVLIGSFSIAESCQKTVMPHLKVPDLSGSSRFATLLKVMLATAALSVVIPNYSAGLVVVSVLKTTPTFTQTSMSNKRLYMMAILTAASIGGILIPTGSPEAIIAYHIAGEGGLAISWTYWMITNSPLAIILIVSSCFVLNFLYDERTAEGSQETSIEEGIPPVEPAPQNPADNIYPAMATAGIAMTTLLLWSTFGYTKGIFGNLGIIALIPIMLLFATGMLDPNDLAKFPWDIVLFVMGALALREALVASGLLQAISQEIVKLISNLHYLTQVIFLSLLVLAAASIKSHVVTALILLPIIVGYITSAGFDSDYRGAALFLACNTMLTIACSLPHATLLGLALLKERDSANQSTILTARDFHRAGLAVSVVCYFITVTLGVGIHYFAYSFIS